MKYMNVTPVFAAAFCLQAVVSMAVPSEADSVENPLVTVWADAALDALDGRTWVLTDGSMDAWLVERGQARGLELVPMPLRQEAPQTLDRLEQAVAKLGSDRLRAAAALGSAALVRQWLLDDPGTAMQSLALLVEPAIVKAAGFEPVPQGVVHHVLSPDAVTEPVLTAAKKRWLDVREALGETIASAPPDAEDPPLVRRLRAQTAVCGNNLGCLLVRADRKEEAFDVFSLAYALNRDGLSALLNMASLVREGIRPGQSDKLGQDLNEVLRDGGGSWNLASTGGFVLRPEDFLDAKWYWASSGLPADNRDGLNAYLAQIEDEALRGAVARQLATTLAMQSGGVEPALALLRDLPEEGLTSDVLLRIADHHLLTGDRLRALRAVEQAADAPGADAGAVAAAKAAIYVRMGRVEDAVAAYEALRPSTNAVFVLGRIANIHSSAGLPGKLVGTLERLADQPDAPAGTDALRQAVAAQIAGDLASAKRFSEVALKAGADTDYALRTALMLDMMTQDKAAAAAHADALLAIHGREPFAHYVKATLAVEGGHHQVAERHFQISLSQNPAWYVLNDYAALAVETGRHDLAEHLARNALSSGGAEYAAVWDTLGTALMNLNRNAEAVEAFKTAVGRPGGDDPRIQLNFAEVILQEGDREAAREAMERVDARKEVLSVAERERLGRLRRALEEETE